MCPSGSCSSFSLPFPIDAVSTRPFFSAFRFNDSDGADLKYAARAIRGGSAGETAEVEAADEEEEGEVTAERSYFRMAPSLLEV